MYFITIRLCVCVCFASGHSKTLVFPYAELRHDLVNCSQDAQSCTFEFPNSNDSPVPSISRIHSTSTCMRSSNVAEHGHLFLIDEDPSFRCEWWPQNIPEIMFSSARRFHFLLCSFGTQRIFLHMSNVLAHSIVCRKPDRDQTRTVRKYLYCSALYGATNLLVE